VPSYELTEKQRQVYELSRRGMGMSKIAFTLNLHRSTVRDRLVGARRNLANQEREALHTETTAGR
jgi:DNA-binding NarL/FixJ family response regulator